MKPRLGVTLMPHFRGSSPAQQQSKVWMALIDCLAIKIVTGLSEPDFSRIKSLDLTKGGAMRGIPVTDLLQETSISGDSSYQDDLPFVYYGLVHAVTYTGGHITLDFPYEVIDAIPVTVQGNSEGLMEIIRAGADSFIKKYPDWILVTSEDEYRKRLAPRRGVRPHELTDVLRLSNPFPYQG